MRMIIAKLWWWIGVYLRWIWAEIIGLVYRIYYVYKARNSEPEYSIKRTAMLTACDSIGNIIKYWKKVPYKWDGKNGILDHDNTLAEFLLTGGDCDDMARLSAYMINLLGWQSFIIQINGYKPWYAHRDCLYYDPKKKTWNLFNYGDVVELKPERVMVSLEGIMIDPYGIADDYNYLYNAKLYDWADVVKRAPLSIRW